MIHRAVYICTCMDAASRGSVGMYFSSGVCTSAAVQVQRCSECEWRDSGLEPCVRIRV